MENAAKLVVLGAFFDFADGFVARYINAQSSIGKDLDSLADLVTFGVVPGFIVYKLLGIYSSNPYFPNIGLSIPIFSAIRLAKFNNDSRQSVDFIGLPTPANALFFISLPLILFSDNTGLAKYIFTTPFLMTATVVSCFLMVSEVKLFSLKIKQFNLKANFYPLLLIVGANILFFSISYTAIPFIIILYIILSLVKSGLQPNIQSKTKK